jgi:hypothetical protein
LLLKLRCCLPLQKMNLMGRLRNSDAEDKPGSNPSAIILPCGRYANFLPAEAMARIFGTVNPLPNLAPSWNVAPTQDAAVVRRHPDTGARHLDLLKWGLLPNWAKEPTKAQRPINVLRDRGEVRTPNQMSSCPVVVPDLLADGCALSFVAKIPARLFRRCRHLPGTGMSPWRSGRVCHDRCHPRSPRRIAWS